MRTLITILMLATLTSSAPAFEEVEWPGALELPGIDDEAWALLSSAEGRETGMDDTWRVIKTFPEELRAATADFTISGFLVPITAQGDLKDLILVQNPAACPFCGGEGYGPVLEVSLKRGIDWLPEFTRVTVRGRLELLEEDNTAQMFRMVDGIVQ